MRFAIPPPAGFEADDFVWRCTYIGVCCAAWSEWFHKTCLIPA